MTKQRMFSWAALIFAVMAARETQAPAPACAGAPPGTCHGFAPPTIELHYAPAEDLEAIDVAALKRATRTIDMAAYILADGAVIDALRAAAARGVIVRLYRNHDGEEHDGGRYPPTAAYRALEMTPGVTIRVKRAWPLMHLKAYAIDAGLAGALLRTGSANFTRSGERDQDNDLVLTRDPAAIARFEADFSRMWGEGE